MTSSSSDPQAGLRPSRFPRVLGWAALAILGLASLHLATHRILQVDEAQQVNQACILARGEAARYFVYAPLHHLGPMAWIAKACHTSKSLFLLNRLLYLAVFWVNIALIGRICAGGWRSRSILGWTLGAATIVPLWDYGFEIRHDNVLLTGLLLGWLCLMRRWRHPWAAFLMAGPLAVALQFLSFKSFLYWAPFLLVLLVAPPPSLASIRPLRRLGLLLAGLGAGLVAVRGIYALSGGWHDAIQGFGMGVASSVATTRFSPLPVLARLARQAPLLVAGGLGLALSWALTRRKAGSSTLTWVAPFPELALLAFLLAAFVVNPTPFPYNLVLFAPFLLVASAALLRAPEWGVLASRPVLPATLAVLAACHLLPFLLLTARHFEKTQDRQIRIQEAAEALTDPATDPVFDGTGLVPTRHPVGYQWLIHSITLGRFRDGTWPSILSLLESDPPPVVIPNYRLDSLSQDEQAFLSAHYIPVADDLLVAGQVLPAGATTWTCLHPGRYQIFHEIQPGGVAQPGVLRIDGRDYANPVILYLDKGDHRVESRGATRKVVAWIGPRLTTMPQLELGDHRELFINWY